jgi:hypothetical protein
VLVVDGRDANAAFVAPGEKGHRDFPWNTSKCIAVATDRNAAIGVGDGTLDPLLAAVPGGGSSLEDYVGLRFVPAGGEDDGRAEN